METPHVGPVGLVEYPEDFTAEPRQYSPMTRIAAWIFLLFFAAITVVSSVVSLGAYCLTSNGADTRALRDSPLLQQSLEEKSDRP